MCVCVCVGGGGGGGGGGGALYPALHPASVVTCPTITTTHSLHSTHTLC